MRANKYSVSLLGLLLALVAPAAQAHAEHDKARFVSDTGVDMGQCDDASDPCRTIAYAATRAAKGDRILVAGGRYEIASAEDLFYLTSGILRLYGGFDRSDRYGRQSPRDNPTILIGVPPEFRAPLERDGFQLIVDRKGLDADAAAQAEALGKNLELMQKSAGNASCVAGDAGGFPCQNVDLLAHLALSDFRFNPGAANDIWGFVDLNTEREYALVGLENGTAVIDVTDPGAPFEVGAVSGGNAVWRDIKVYQFFDAGAARWRAYAYVTTDGASDQLTVIDLGGLPNSVRLAGRRTEEARAHNVYIGNVDYTTGTVLDGFEPVLFTAGSNRSSGGFRAYVLTDPENPSLVAVSPSLGYSHDASSMLIADQRKDTQCVNAIEACAVLLDFNETTFELWDFSQRNDPRQLSSSTYANVGYVHSGWPTEDAGFMFVHDELDERDAGLATTLRVFSLSNLGAPALAGTWTGATDAIDHNGYVRGNRYYMSNYTRGLTVLDITDPTRPLATGSFDTYTISDATAFNGAWGVHPFLPSGRVLVSDINSGLYVLEDRSLETVHGSLSFVAAVSGGVEGERVEVAVSRVGGSTGAVSVDYETLSATADRSDYEPVSGRLSWSAGDDSDRSVAIDLIPDGAVEQPQRLFVRLFNPAGGATLAAPRLASVFSSDAGATAELGFAEPEYAIRADAGRVLLVVRRQGSAQGEAALSYRTETVTAEAGEDYVEVNDGRLSWGDRDATARTIEIALLANPGNGGAVSFKAMLFNPEGASLGAISETLVNVEPAGNLAPFANAGSDLSVTEGASVSLTGSQSSDPDGDPLSFVWGQTAGPLVTLIDADRVTARFTAPSVNTTTQLVFRLTVTDSAGNTDGDSVTVTVSALASGGGGGGGGGGALAPVLLVVLLGGLVAARRRRPDPCRADPPRAAPPSAR